MKGKVKEDLRKLKCYTCGNNGHFASKCTQRKKGDNEKEITMDATSSGELDDFSRRFKEEFSLVSNFFEDTIGWVHGSLIV